jgi:hypothetical protein
VHNQEVDFAIIGAVGLQKTEQFERSGSGMPSLLQEPPPERRRARQFLQDEEIHLPLFRVEPVVAPFHADSMEC